MANNAPVDQSTLSRGSGSAEGLEAGSARDVKDWEAVRCPICLEHPHNAVLLMCSAYENGCRPYVCNTSYRHSNCLDQFVKSSVSCPSTAVMEEVPSRSAISAESMDLEELPLDGQMRPRPACPLCRGEIQGWFVEKDVRGFMNSKVRACCLETCDFSGNYSELRKHARRDHPSSRPSDVDPQRQEDWRRMMARQRMYDAMGLTLPETGRDDVWLVVTADGDGNDEEDNGREEEREHVGLPGLFWVFGALAAVELNLSLEASNRQSNFSFENNSGSRFWEGNPSAIRSSNNFRRNSIRERSPWSGRSSTSNRYLGTRMSPSQQFRRRTTFDNSHDRQFQRRLTSNNHHQQRTLHLQQRRRSTSDNYHLERISPVQHQHRHQTSNYYPSDGTTYNRQSK